MRICLCVKDRNSERDTPYLLVYLLKHACFNGCVTDLYCSSHHSHKLYLSISHSLSLTHEMTCVPFPKL